MIQEHNHTKPIEQRKTKLDGNYFRCADGRCRMYGECKDHDRTLTHKCKKCHKVDCCMALRDGLCLDCFAKKYNAENPYTCKTTDFVDGLSHMQSADDERVCQQRTNGIKYSERG
jgi:hypothetical protein